MHINQKRGQFFLIAALVIISIIFSFGIIYNSASAQKTDTKTRTLSDSLKYESLQLINQGVYSNLSYNNVTDNIKNLTFYYSNSNPEYNITIIYSTSPSSLSDPTPNFEAHQYKKGVSVQLTSPAPHVNYITLNLNSIDYNFNITKGHNFYVIVAKEDEDEKSISTA